MTPVFRGRILIVILAVLVLAVAGHVQAQQAPPEREAARPVRPIFGGEATGATGQSLVVSGNVSGGSDALTTLAPDGTVLAERRGAAAAGSASLAYTVERGWFAGNVSGTSTARRYSGADVRQVSYVNYGGADLQMNVPMGRRTRLEGRASASYQPVSASTLFPDLFRTDGPVPLPTEFDLATPLAAYLATDLGATLVHAFSPRSSLELLYVVQDRGPIGVFDELEGQRTQTAGGRFRRNLTQNLGLRVGYGRLWNVSTEAESDRARLTNHSIDVGLDYSRALSFSRRTSLSFGSGSLAVSDGETTRFDVVGNVDLAHQIGRSWLAGLSYVRDVDFVQVLAQPTFSDSLAASLGGRPFQRLTVSAGAGVSAGRLGLSTEGNRYSAYQSTIGLSVSISRLLSLNMNYAYYRYRFGESDPVPSSIATRARRHLFQIGTGVSLPLFHRTRRTNASR